MLLDTNVISELLKPSPSTQVMGWFETAPEALYVSAFTRAELFLGAALLPPGKRRRELEAGLHEMFASRFAARCLSFDEAAADCFVEVKVHRIRHGLAMGTEDAQIAAIALAQGLALVTRNVKDFARLPGLEVVNPWEA